MQEGLPVGVAREKYFWAGVKIGAKPEGIEACAEYRLFVCFLLAKSVKEWNNPSAPGMGGWWGFADHISGTLIGIRT